LHQKITDAFLNEERGTTNPKTQLKRCFIKPLADGNIDEFDLSPEE
jgi:hypothetical protein